METYEKYEKRIIKDLEYSKFDYRVENICYQQVHLTSLLRKALLICNRIGNIDDEEVRSKLNNLIDIIMKEKFRELNPNLEESVLNEMVSYYHRGIYQFPIDLFVIGDAIFSKEIELNDFGSPYKIKTFMYNNNGTYFNAFDPMSFSVVENIFEFVSKGITEISKEQEMKISKIISDSINSALISKFECKVTRPSYELMGHFGSDVLSENEISGIAIFLNKHHRDIARSMIKKEECDIRMIVQYGDDISLYNFHQSFVGDEPVWESKLVEEHIWKLSEAAIAFENNMQALKLKLEEKSD